MRVFVGIPTLVFVSIEFTVGKYPNEMILHIKASLSKDLH